MTNGRENKKLKERELEEFRSFRTSKRRKEEKQINDEIEVIKTQNCFMSVKNSSEKPSNEVVILKLKHLVEF